MVSIRKARNIAEKSKKGKKELRRREKTMSAGRTRKKTNLFKGTGA